MNKKAYTQGYLDKEANISGAMRRLSKTFGRGAIHKQPRIDNLLNKTRSSMSGSKAFDSADHLKHLKGRESKLLSMRGKASRSTEPRALAATAGATAGIGGIGGLVKWIKSLMGNNEQ
jgi:hypothetical protein